LAWGHDHGYFRARVDWTWYVERAQPGDPAKAAAVILKVASPDEPPLRRLLGSDAVRIVEQADLARTEADRKWRHLSVSTDFDADR
jgi:hypothetical protein